MSEIEKLSEERCDTDQERRVEVLERELATIRGRLRQTLAVLDETQSQQHALLASTSWRITAPLRAIKSLIGRSRAPRALQKDEIATTPDRPFVPRPLCSLAMDADAEPNATYRLVDARDAMQPLIRARAPVDGEVRGRILFLGSAELAEELSYDIPLTVLDKASWRQLLQPGQFDYLLLEPAWRMIDPAWDYCMVHSGKERAELIEAIVQCRALSLPTVAWVRDDAAGYENLAWLGDHVDRVYAIDEALVARYRANHPNKIVSLLPLAIQPAIHNPIRSYALFESASEFLEKTLYDGWYDLLSQPEQSAFVKSVGGEGLRVCESEWEFGRARLHDVDAMGRYILGCVESIDKNALGKLFGAEIFCEKGYRSEVRSRQAMLRALACGSQVLAVGDLARGPVIPEGVVKGLQRDQVADALRWGIGHPLELAGLLHAARRRLMKEHTYAQRLNRIADDLGIPVPDGAASHPPRISVILVTKRPQLLAGCLERFRNDIYPNKELFVVMHGEHNLAAAQALVRGGEAVQIHGMREHHSLGECLNFAIQQTGSPYWCKVDDDDLYGPSYIDDIMLTRHMVDFDLAGKPPVFTLMRQRGALYWDPGWFRYANLLYDVSDSRSAFIAGATIVARRSAVAEIRFSERRRAGADSKFIGECLDSGARVLAADPFGFVRYRAGSSGAHTWRMDEEAFVRSAKALAGADAVERLAFV